MKYDERILKILSQKPATDVSGEELARELGISRAAVWKRIKRLRETGFKIGGETGRGYRLEGIEDLIKLGALNKKLQTRIVGKKLIYKPITKSTNSDAFALAWDGAPDGTCVIADVQTAGRGRLGRSWIAPAGSAVLTSVVLRPPLTPQTATLLTLAAGIAVARTVKRVTDIEPWIKWPNDIFVANKKLAGILTEMHAELDKVHFVVIGIGMNVNIDRKALPADIRKIATSLSIEAKREINRNQLIATLYFELEHAYYRLIEKGKKTIIEQWEEISGIHGKKVRASLIDGSKVLGTAAGLDSEGSLVIVDPKGGKRYVTAGDIEITKS